MNKEVDGIIVSGCFNADTDIISSLLGDHFHIVLHAPLDNGININDNVAFGGKLMLAQKHVDAKAPFSHAPFLVS